MPLPSDEKLIALSQDVLKQFDAIFGLHPGFRPAHAKGVMLAGTFTPAAEAASLTRAPHITRDSTPVTVRFSNSKALAFVQTPKPCPSSFARETYFGVTAMRFTDQDGVSRFGRYRITPDAGNDHPDDATTKSKDANFL